MPKNAVHSKIVVFLKLDMLLLYYMVKYNLTSIIHKKFSIAVLVKARLGKPPEFCRFDPGKHFSFNKKIKRVH